MQVGPIQKGVPAPRPGRGQRTRLPLRLDLEEMDPGDCRLIRPGDGQSLASLQKLICATAERIEFAKEGYSFTTQMNPAMRGVQVWRIT